MTKRIISLLLTVFMLTGALAFAIPANAADSCTIMFDANGGTGVGMPEDITVAPGTIITLPKSAPAKPGMVFMGWAFNKEDADNGVITYAAGTTPQILVNNSAILYASYAYSVVLNHGNRGWGNTAVQLYKFPGKDLELFHKKDLIHANYGMLPGAPGETTNLMVFMEWNTSQASNGLGNGIGYHERYTTNASTTLYCIWGNPVSYNADGGIFPATGTDRQSKYVVNWSLQKHDDTTFGLFDFPGEENSPTKPGCRLFTNDEGETVYARVFLNGNIYRYESADTWLDMPIFNGPGYKWEDFYTYILPIEERALELYAVWEPSVTYKANGGDGADIVEYMEHIGPTLYSYADYTIRNNAFVKDDGRFLGWNTKPDGSGESYTAGDVITGYDTSDPIILYAQWSDAAVDTEEYTVTFNAMEGYLPFEEQSFEIAYGEAYADAFELPVPTRSGYLFKGWYNEETKSYLNYEDEIYSLNRDSVFTATWVRHDNHHIEDLRVDSTCMTEGSYTAVCKTCDYYSTITYDKTGHTFTDWNYTGESDNVIRSCTLCGASENDTIPPSVQQQVIAYINKNVAYGTVDFPYIDVLNYLGPAIDGGPGEYPFAESYFGEAAYMRQVATAKNPNIKIVCTIFNRNIVKFENWLRTPALRAEFANHLTGVVFANNFDGLDIDFEFPSDLSLRDEYALLLGEIRARFNARTAQTGRQYILSIATPAAHWATEKFDLVACAQYLDYFNIMNYDLYCGSAVPYTHHHTPPFDNVDPYGHVPRGGSVQGDINMYKALGIPGDKIVSGMGLYSREWTGVPNRNNGLFQPAALQASNYHYDLLMASFVNKNGYVRYWDDTSKAPYLFNAGAGIFLSYEDPESINYKCQIVSKERVRGVMVFDYVTCDGTGIFGHIRSQLGSVLHACTPGNTETKAASCTENGYTKTYCYFCEALIKHTEVYHEGHYATDWTVVTPATKGTAGIEEAVCLNCNESFTREIPALGYKVSFDAGEGKKLGSTAFIINKGQTYADVVGEDPQATLEGTSLVGWYADGYMLNTSDTFSFDSDVVFTAVWEEEGEHTHRYTSKITKAATCTADGVITYTCRCGESYTESIPKLDHEYVGSETIAPTCGAEGEYTYSCINCGDSYTEVIAALEHSYDTGTTTVMPTCTEEGIKTYTCTVCGGTKTESIAALGHVWKAWEVVKEATETEDGLQQRSCRRGCGTVEEEVIPALGGGETAELAVSSDGPNLTVSGMVDVKDVFIALGDYDTYADVKANAVVRLTPEKLAGAESYTYTLKAGGYYTVLVRYNDGTSVYLYHQIDVTEPTFAANGLQLTVGNLADVKVIRTAYGEHKSVSAIKKAEGARSFTAKNDIKGADSYMIQYRKSGTVTVAVQYEDGYTKIYTYEVEQKVPVFTQSNNVVTIGNIDDLYVIRYAPGEYTTSAQIKAAAGSKALKADSAVDGVITVKNLKAGTYTFCVQYNDESYNYYVITVE